MKEQGRPTLTLRRKTEPEGQRAVNNSEPDGAGPGRVTRKKTVVVNTTPAWKVRKQAVDESAKKAQADEKAARKAEKARLWAVQQAQEREAMRAARRKPAPEPVYRKVMPLADALVLWALLAGPRYGRPAAAPRRSTSGRRWSMTFAGAGWRFP